MPTDINYPVTLDDSTTLPEPTDANNQDQVGFVHADLHTKEAKAIKAVQAKVGSASSTPTANTVLRGTGTGTSAWGKVTASYLSGGGAGDANKILATTDGTTVALQKIVNANIDDAAGIAVSKLADGAARQALVMNAAGDTPSWTTLACGATLFVAANDATAAEKALAHYVCDGTDDHVQINAATAALPATGGSVGLSSGTFSLGAAVTYGRPNTLIYGAGPSTVLKGQAGCGNIWLVAVNNTSARLRDVKIDGNKAVNAAYTTTTACYITSTDPIIENVTVVNSPGYGFFFEVGTTAAIGRNLVSDGCVNVGYYVRAAASPNGNATTLIGCIARNNGSDGFANDSGIARFIGCIAYGNTGNGYGSSAADTTLIGCESVANLQIGVYSAGARTSIQGCVSRSNSGSGIYTTGTDALINGNKVYLNSLHGIQVVNTATGAQVTDNIVRENGKGAASTYDNINIASSYSFIAGNTARRGASGNRAAYGLRIAAGATGVVVQPNDLYDSGMTGDFLDSGTGTRFIRTSDLEANAVTAPRANINPTAGQTTTSTTLVAMTAGSVSFTTSPQLGQIYLFGRMRLSSSAASGNISVYLYKDGVIHQEIVIQNLAANYSAQSGVAIPLTMTGIAANTTYTFALYWSGPTGTTTFGDGSLTIQEFKR